MTHVIFLSPIDRASNFDSDHKFSAWQSIRNEKARNGRYHFSSWDAYWIWPSWNWREIVFQLAEFTCWVTFPWHQMLTQCVWNANVSTANTHFFVFRSLSLSTHISLRTILDFPTNGFCLFLSFSHKFIWIFRFRFVWDNQKMEID